jgi:6-phosphogluconolactonase
MSFLRAALAALAGQNRLPRISVAVAVLLAVFSLSCGSSSHKTPTGPNHNAYVSLPDQGAVGLLHIDGATGVLTLGAKTPVTVGNSTTGLALLPSKKFLYAVNSRANTISIFTVASDGTLTLTGTPTPSGTTPDAAVIDPSGKYLLVTNSVNFTGSVSVYSIDGGSGALTEVQGSPFFANSSPTEILFTHSGNFVYVTNPGIGMVTGFRFDPTAAAILTPVPNSPFPSAAQGGAAALAVDGGDRFLYVANPSAANPPPNQATVGNISGFIINPNTGELSDVLGSPFTATNGKSPTAITVDPSGRFVYAVTEGSSFSIWCFSITSAIGQTNGQLVAVTGSPFSMTAGGLFALIDPSGNYFYIGSQSGTAIDGYTYNPSTGVPTVITGTPFSTGSAPGKMVLSE